MTRIQKEILEAIEVVRDERNHIWKLYDEGLICFENAKVDIDVLDGRIDGLSRALEIVEYYLDV